MKKMGEAELHARMELDATQRSIWRPIVKGMEDYLKWFAPVQKTCKVDTMTSCMEETVTVGDVTTDHDWILCGERAGCSATWDSLTFK